MGTAQAKMQRLGEQGPHLEVKREGEAAHPYPFYSSGICPWGPAVSSCVARSRPQVPRSKPPRTALSQDERAMAGKYPRALAPCCGSNSNWCFIPLPRSPQRDGAPVLGMRPAYESMLY